MSKHKPDVNETAARIARESTGEPSKAPTCPELEAAWIEWLRGVQKVDERGMSLLRAAFEAGYEAGNSRN
jgi:hypothetical protein